jgi:2-amino-4-hydroxy-6-hydroxymethyldihydropteridine diphosphokinase
MSDTHLIYLSLGSNVGDRATNLERAIQALNSRNITVLRRSSFYETEPVDFVAQPWFLNCVLQAQTVLIPAILLRELQEIEQEMGSHKPIPKGPRLIDLDVLLYDESIVSLPGVEIPHPRMAQRRFVLVPFAEIAPALVHPQLGTSVAELLSTTPDKSTVRVWHPHSQS